MSTTITELLKHTTVRAALAVTGVILVGSAAYYVIETEQPALAYATVTSGSVSEDVTGTGTVSPVENPSLSFVSAGRVTQVNVKVGDKVSAGTLLAALDTGVLSANAAAANAHYAGLANGPRAVDVAGKQTMLTNAYEALPSVIADAVANVEDAVHSVDTLFGSFNTVDYPRINFQSRSGSADKAGQERGTLTDAFVELNRSLENLSGATQEEKDAALDDATAKLSLARDFFTDLSEAANSAEVPLAASDIATISAGRATVNGLIVSLLAEKQTLASDRDALNLIQAGSDPEDVAVAKAQADAAVAALRQSEIIAPYAGTVASVAVKTGDVVSANAPGVSVIPDSNFEIEIYLSEIDAAKITAGATADVTIDAYGSGTPFSATVTSIDRAPTVRNGVPSYKATLVFDKTDTKLAVGQGANAVIHVGGKENVLLVPTSALITENNQTYVLLAGANGSVKTPVEVGLIGSTSAEIISGLAEGDRVALVGK